MNIATFIVLLVVAAWMFFAIYYTFFRKGHSSCDCGASCNHQEDQQDYDIDVSSCPHAQTHGCGGCNGCSSQR